MSLDAEALLTPYACVLIGSIAVKGKVPEAEFFLAFGLQVVHEVVFSSCLGTTSWVMNKKCPSSDSS